MKKEKLWILSELFYPETTSTAYILTEIAKKLAIKYEVHVICGNPVYDIGSQTADIPEIIIHRLTGRKIDKNNKVKRIFRALTLSSKLKKELVMHKDEVNKVFMVTNPIFLLPKISNWTKKNGKELTLLVHDVFPENAKASGLIKIRFFFKFLKKYFDRAYKKCDKIIVIGNDMKDVIVSKGVEENKVSIIQNWANIENIKPSNNTSKTSSKIRIQFAGNMGRVQGLCEFFDILSQVHNSDIEFIFTGSGAVKKELQEKSKNIHGVEITFNLSYSRDEENRVLNDCDIALISLNENMYGLGVPSKTYNNMAAGKALLFVGPKNSEIFSMINESQIGYCFDAQSKEEIISFFNNLNKTSVDIIKDMGKNSRVLAEREYSKDVILNKYISIV